MTTATTTRARRPPTRRDEGYRYIRAYRGSWPGWRYQLWERRDGRMRRVGTARTEDAYRAFLFPGEATP